MTYKRIPSPWGAEAPKTLRDKAKPAPKKTREKPWEQMTKRERAQVRKYLERSRKKQAELNRELTQKLKNQLSEKRNIIADFAAGLGDYSKKGGWKEWNKAFAEKMKAEDEAYNDPRTARERIKAMQRVIFTKLGLLGDPGAAIDGEIGPYTRAAMAAYAGKTSGIEVPLENRNTALASAVEKAGEAAKDEVLLPFIGTIPDLNLAANLWVLNGQKKKAKRPETKIPQKTPKKLRESVSWSPAVPLAFTWRARQKNNFSRFGAPTEQPFTFFPRPGETPIGQSPWPAPASVSATASPALLAATAPLRAPTARPAEQKPGPQSSPIQLNLQPLTPQLNASHVWDQDKGMLIEKPQQNPFPVSLSPGFQPIVIPNTNG